MITLILGLLCFAAALAVILLAHAMAHAETDDSEVYERTTTHRRAS